MKENELVTYRHCNTTTNYCNIYPTPSNNNFIITLATIIKILLLLIHCRDANTVVGSFRARDAQHDTHRAATWSTSLFKFFLNITRIYNYGKFQIANAAQRCVVFAHATYTGFRLHLFLPTFPLNSAGFVPSGFVQVLFWSELVD